MAALQGPASSACHGGGGGGPQAALLGARGLLMEAEGGWLRRVTAAWQQGRVCNFDYLLYLNLAAGEYITIVFFKCINLAHPSPHPSAHPSPHPLWRLCLTFCRRTRLQIFTPSKLVYVLSFAHRPFLQRSCPVARVPMGAPELCHPGMRWMARIKMNPDDHVSMMSFD